MYQLGAVPAGLSWDEAAIGYNGSAIWKARRDEWLVRLPVSFKSFGDYKAPLAIYINGVFTGILGMTPWAVRLPFALAGIFSILFMSGVLYELFRMIPHSIRIPDFQKMSLTKTIVIFGVFIMATSVWNIHFSRAGFESGMALSFVCFMAWMWLLGQRFIIEKKQKLTLLTIIFVGIAGSLAMYTYHSAKIAVPLLFGVFLLTSSIQWKQRWKLFGASLLVLLIVSHPLLQDTFFAKGAERFHQTSLFSQSTGIGIPFVITRNLLAHFSLDFLLNGQTTTLRHGDGKWGVLFFSEWLLLITSGVSMVFLMRRSRRTQQIKEITRVFLFALGWIVSGMLPATIGVEIPHANRALLAYPGFLILMCLGLFFLFKLWYFFLHNKSLFVQGRKFASESSLLILKAVLGLTLLTHCLLFLSYWQNYFLNYSAFSADAFQNGYQQVFEYVIPEEEKVEKILFSDTYGQPYIYALFFRQTNPIWYQGGSLIKYEFTNKISTADLQRNNTLIVATPDQIDPTLGDRIIQAPDGSVRFVIIKTPVR